MTDVHDAPPVERRCYCQLVEVPSLPLRSGVYSKTSSPARIKSGVARGAAGERESSTTGFSPRTRDRTLHPFSRSLPDHNRPVCARRVEALDLRLAAGPVDFEGV